MFRYKRAIFRDNTMPLLQKKLLKQTYCLTGFRSAAASLFTLFTYRKYNYTNIFDMYC